VTRDNVDRTREKCLRKTSRTISRLLKFLTCPDRLYRIWYHKWRRQIKEVTS